MPAIVGPIKINEISGGVVNFGDSFIYLQKALQSLHSVLVLVILEISLSSTMV